MRLRSTALILFAAAAPAAAQNPFSDTTDAVRTAVEAGELMSFVQILDNVSARNAAFVTEVGLTRESVADRETWVYEIEALDEDLEAVEIEVNGRTGEVLEIDD